MATLTGLPDSSGFTVNNLMATSDQVTLSDGTITISEFTIALEDGNFASDGVKIGSASIKAGPAAVRNLSRAMDRNGSRAAFRPAVGWSPTCPVLPHLLPIRQRRHGCHKPT